MKIFLNLKFLVGGLLLLLLLVVVVVFSLVEVGIGIC
jgi:hypothetical protein